MKKKMKETKFSLAWIVFPSLVLGVGLWWGWSSFFDGRSVVGPSIAWAQGHQHPPSAEKGKPPAAPQAAKPEPPPPPAPTVEIPPDKQKLIGLKTTVAGLQSLAKTIRTVGRIEIDERKQAFINAKVEGWIEKLYVNATGVPVKQGQPIAEIYSPELLATQQELLNVLRWKKSLTREGFGALLAQDAEAILEAARQRLRLWDISEDQIRLIEETGQPVRALTLYSPVSGQVMQKMAIQGMKIMPGEKLFEVVDLATIWVAADIYESDLPLIKVGDRAQVRLSYFPGQDYSAVIDFIYPILSAESRTARARFTLPNPQGKLKPQMFGQVEIKINMGRRLAVPEDAVLDTGTRQIIYIDKGEGNFEPREITAGLRAEKWVEILKGVKPGEKVASSANFLIDSEAKLKGIAPKSDK
jgi:membrane fusion protein, copper/silver efflux system